MEILHKVLVEGTKEASVGAGAAGAAASGGADPTALCRRALEEWGLEPRLVSRGGDTLLHAAARAGRADLVRLLLVALRARYASPNPDQLLANRAGLTPLHLAIRGGGAGHVECALALIEADKLGRACVELTGKERVPPLLLAAAAGQTQVCRALLGKGASVHARNAAGCSALHLAVAEGHEATARWLVAEGKADLRASDSKGRWPVHVAIQYKRSALAAFLEEADGKRSGARRGPGPRVGGGGSASVAAASSSGGGNGGVGAGSGGSSSGGGGSKEEAEAVEQVGCVVLAWEATALVY